MLVETLLGDFGGHRDRVDTTVDARPDVWAHNIEVVRRLQRTIRDVRCSYEQSLGVLGVGQGARAPEPLTKSSIMVGIGETDDEVLETMRDLRAAGVDIVTLGQYLRPTPKHAPVDRYVEPEQFDDFAREGRAMGFAFVASGPARAQLVQGRRGLRAQPADERGEWRGRRGVLRERLAEAHPRSASELAAREAAVLLPAQALVRRA